MQCNTLTSLTLTFCFYSQFFVFTTGTAGWVIQTFCKYCALAATELTLDIFWGTWQQPVVTTVTHLMAYVSH